MSSTSKISGRSAFHCSTWLVTLLLLFTVKCVRGFSVTRPLGSRSLTLEITRGSSSSNPRHVKTHESTSMLFLADSSDDGQAPVLHPALSQEEVDSWLSSVPVYALTSSEGIFLLYGPDGDAVAYFFLTKAAAETMASQLQEIGMDGADDIAVAPLSLGKIWFGMLDPSGADRVEGVEYRLVPDPRDLNGARMLMTDPELQTAKPKSEEKDGSEDAISSRFQSPFNEIPIFLDVRMRVPAEVDGETIEQLPMYLGLQDMVRTCERFLATEETSINVADLNDLVGQMQQDSTVDFRRAVLVQPEALAM